MKKTIRWGILGTGKIAHKFAAAMPFVEDAEIVAVASRAAHKSAQFAQDFGIKYAHSSYQALAENPEVDAVYIATPHIFHCANTLLCLEAGKGVLCEKPFAMNLQEARQMIAKAREKKVFLMEALWTRFSPHFEKVEELILDGSIGEIRLIQADLGFQAPYDEMGRLFNPDLGGGALLDVGVYPIFLAYCLLGKPTTIQASARIGRTQVDEHCGMIFQYPKHEMALLSCSLITHQSIEANIFGETGRIRLNTPFYKPSSRVEIIRPFDQIEPVEVEFVGNGYNYEIQEAVRCMQAGKIESEIWSWQESLELMEILDEVREKIGLTYPLTDGD
jgi:predicted dehydrogenase